MAKSISLVFRGGGLISSQKQPLKHAQGVLSEFVLHKKRKEESDDDVLKRGYLQEEAIAS